MIGPLAQVPYLQIQTDPRFSAEWGSTEQIPVTNTNLQASQWSPFRISMVPPDLFGDSGVVLQNRTRRRAQYASMMYQKATAQQNTKFVQDVSREALRQNNGVSSGQLSQIERVRVKGQTRLSAQTAQIPKAFQDTDHARDLLEQYLELAAAPPLTLLINPTQMSTQWTKIAQFTERTRNGNVYQVWGEDLPMVSLTIPVGGFVSSERGLSWFSRMDSLNWHAFTALLMMFRNGAALYDRLQEGSPIHSVGLHRIDYDGWAYLGGIESLDYSYVTDQVNTIPAVTLSLKVHTVLDLTDPVTTIQPMAPPQTPGWVPVSPSYGTDQTPDSPPVVGPPSAFRKR